MKNTLWDKDLQYHANIQPIGDTPTGSALNVAVSGTGTSVDSPLDVRTQARGYRDTNNSTTTPLGINATFVGSATDVSGAAAVTIWCSTDAASVTKGLKIYYSPDGISDWEVGEEYTVLAGAKKFFTPTIQNMYMKIEYQNDGVGQTEFHLHTVIRTTPIKWSSHNIEEAIKGEDDAQLTKSVLTGLAPDGTYKNVLVTNQGNQKVSIEEFESGVSTNSNTQLKVTPYLPNGNAGIAFADSPAIDAFSRIRTSSVATAFESMLQYDLDPIKNFQVVAGTGAITHLPNESAAQISTGGTASGASAIYQSKEYIRYQAGKSQLAFLTANLGAAKTNVRKRIGLFDVDNGFYFEEAADGTKYAVIRSKTSGGVVNNAVAQSSWNLDTLDGAGASGVTIDWSKSNIFVLDFQWLGVGRVRMGFDVDGLVIYCHEFLHANSITSVYMTTPHLPVRTEIENTGTAASATAIKKFCSAVIAEGGLSETPAYPFAAHRGSATLGVTTRRPVLSIRCAPTFQSITNRGHITFRELELLAATNNATYELVVGGTLTGAVWTSVDATNSIAQYDTTATAITGGRVHDIGYVLSGGGVSKGVAKSGDIPIQVFNDYAGTAPAIISIVCTSFTGTSNINALIRWAEQR